MDKKTNFKLLLLALVWTASLLLSGHPAYPSAEPIEQLPRDLVKLGSGIGRIPRSFYSQDEARDLVRSTAVRLWKFSKPEQETRRNPEPPGPQGLRIRYSF